MTSTAAKILSLEDARKERERLRAEGKRVVVLSGSFDILHAGHIAYIENAREQGDALLALLNSDSSVRIYKGEGRPVLDQDNRARVLASLEAVDAVVIFDELTPVHALEALAPDVYANGSDWGVDCVERPVIERLGGRLHVFSSGELKQSSTALIERLRASEHIRGVRAVFLDRDGTLIENKQGYLHAPEDIAFVPGAFAMLRKLQDAGYLLVLITNQSGIGRGYYSEADLSVMHRHLTEILELEGVGLAGIYHCPHVPTDGCACRKPEPGMLVAAAQEHGIVLNQSWLIGDSCSDAAAGRNANVRSIRIGSPDEVCETEAHFVVPTLAAAADIILAHS